MEVDFAFHTRISLYRIPSILSTHAMRKRINPALRDHRILRFRCWNDRQHDTRRMFAIHKHRILRAAPAPVSVQGLTSIRIHVEPGKIAARYIQPDSVAALENNSGRIHLDGELIRPSRLKEFGFAPSIPIPRSHDAV